MDQPTTTNQTANNLNTAILKVSGTLCTMVETAIIADVPFLGAPVVKQLWETLFNFIASYFIKYSENGVTFAVIDVQTDQEQSNMSDALKNLLAAEKSGDQNAIQNAIAAYAVAQSALVHDDGSATAQ